MQGGRRRNRRAVLGASAAGLLVLAAGSAVALRAGDPDAAGRAATGQGGAPGASPPVTPTPTGPGRLLPNLIALEASEVQLEQVEGMRRLRFTGSLANAGAGPLRLDPLGDPTCPAGERGSEQVVHLDADGDGRYASEVDTEVVRAPTGCMLFHDGHDHWHFDSSARYELTTADGSPAAVQDKVSFCMRDNQPLPGASVVAPEHFGGCTRDAGQGISPGWVDIYRFDLPGQVLDLPPALSDGAYCLRITVDPYALIAESIEADNTSVVPLRLAGGSVEPPPTRLCPAA